MVVAHSFNPNLGGRGAQISEFEASQVHRVSSRQPGLPRETLSQKIKPKTIELEDTYLVPAAEFIVCSAEESTHGGW